MERNEIKKIQKKAVYKCWNTDCSVLDVTKKCSACLQVFYCSAECQRIHWPDHKKLCKLAKADRSINRVDYKGDLRKLYDSWKLPRVHKLALLADFLLPGNYWKTHFIFMPVLVKEGKRRDREIELEMNSWHIFTINDNGNDSDSILGSTLPLTSYRSQIMAFRATVPQHLLNFRQAQIIFSFLDAVNGTSHTAYSPTGTNLGTIPGLEREKIITDNVIKGIVNSINNTPWDYVPSDRDDYEWRQFLQ